eukprot:Ihof_evm2s218 gene=Ihof_evmTU2s218
MLSRMHRVALASRTLTKVATYSRPILVANLRHSHTTATGAEQLKERLDLILPRAVKDIKHFREKYGHISLGNYTIEQVYGGSRGIKTLVTETSLLDPEEGIRYRGHALPELREILPKAPGGTEPLPEAAFWLLVTGEVPTQEQTNALSREFAERADLPAHVVTMINNFPNTLHPMAQFASAISAMHSESKFAKAYNQGVHKSKYWEYTLEDAMDCIAKVPVVAAMIYRNIFKDGTIGAIDPDKDLGANFASLLGYEDPRFTELLRLYLVIHADHEGGNVSAHTTHLVSSALSDPYLSLSAGLCGLAGPLHGLANQEVLVWLTKLKERLGPNWEGKLNEKDVTEMVQAGLDAGQKIPGFGHAVLRRTDPRYICQREFAFTHLPEDPNFKL